jgi:hypothetical protein
MAEEPPEIRFDTIAAHERGRDHREGQNDSLSQPSGHCQTLCSVIFWAQVTFSRAGFEFIPRILILPSDRQDRIAYNSILSNPPERTRLMQTKPISPFGHKSNFGTHTVALIRRRSFLAVASAVRRPPRRPPRRKPLQPQHWLRRQQFR